MHHIGNAFEVIECNASELQYFLIVFQTKTHLGMSMMPMSMETDAMEEMEGAAEIAEVRRKKRSTPSPILSEVNCSLFAMSSESLSYNFCEFRLRLTSCHAEFCDPSMPELSLKWIMANVYKKFCAKIINMPEVVRTIRKFGCRFGGKWLSDGHSECGIILFYCFLSGLE